MTCFFSCKNKKNNMGKYSLNTIIYIKFVAIFFKGMKCLTNN